MNFENETEKAGYYFLNGMCKSAYKKIMICIVGFFVVILAQASFNTVDNSDKNRLKRSGMKIRTDYMNCVQYFESNAGTITKRVNVDGSAVLDEKCLLLK